MINAAAELKEMDRPDGKTAETQKTNDTRTGSNGVGSETKERRTYDEVYNAVAQCDIIYIFSV